MISHFGHLERHDGRVSASNSPRVRERPGASHRSRPDRRRRPASAAAPPITHLRDGLGARRPGVRMPPWRRLGRPGRHLRDAPSDPGTPSPPPTGAPAATDPAGSDGCSSDGRRGRPYGGNRRLTPTDAITAPASSTPRAPVGRFRGLPVGRSAAAARAALALPGLAVFFYRMRQPSRKLTGPRREAPSRAHRTTPQAAVGQRRSARPPESRLLGGSAQTRTTLHSNGRGSLARTPATLLR